MKEVVVIGDVHGCALTLIVLVAKIKLQFPDAIICIAGDLIDRGPRSREVVQFVLDNDIKCVKGNHEQMMSQSLDQTTEYPGNWEFNGGYQTLQSYNGFDAQLIAHKIWMDNLPLYLDFKDCIRESDNRYLVVSHSAIGKVYNWSEQKRTKDKKTFEQVILWERDLYKDVKEIYNIHGHSPKPEPVIKSFYANVDTGCCFKRPGSEQYGVLTALAYPSMTLIQQGNID